MATRLMVLGCLLLALIGCGESEDKTGANGPMMPAPTGLFSLAGRVSVDSRPSGIAVADLNADGILDVVTVSFRAFEGTGILPGTVAVLRGRGDGSFAAVQTFAVGVGSFAIAVGDLNADGIPDIVTANSGSNDLSVLLGRGDGSFTPSQTFLADVTESGILSNSTV